MLVPCSRGDPPETSVGSSKSKINRCRQGGQQRRQGSCVEVVFGMRGVRTRSQDADDEIQTSTVQYRDLDHWQGYMGRVRRAQDFSTTSKQFR